MAQTLDAPQGAQDATAAQGLKPPALPVAPVPATPKAPGVPAASSALPVAGTATASQGMPAAGAPVGTSDPMAFASPLTNPVSTGAPTLAAQPADAPGPAQLAPQMPAMASPFASPARATTLDQDKAQMRSGGSLGDPAYRGLHWNDISGAYENGAGQAWNGNDPNASATTAAWDAFTPNAGLTELQKNQEGAAQGAPVSAAYSGDPKNPLDAAKEAALAAAGKPLLASTQTAQQNALAGTNADIGQQNAFGAQQDAAAQRAADEAIARGAGNSSSVGGGGSGGSHFSPPSGPSDVGPGGSTSNPGGSSLPVAQAPVPATPGVLPVAPADPRVGRGVATTPTTPDNALTNSTISVDPGVDRVKVAGDVFDQFAKSSDPAYQATLRAQDAHDFAEGRGVSGMHRNSIGDIATQRANTLDTERKTLIDNATTGTIGDAKDAAALAVQQQGFQRQQGQDAFGNAVTAQNLSDNENSQAFQQALQQILVGTQGDPAQFKIQLAALYGGQSAANTAAASNLARSTA